MMNKYKVVFDVTKNYFALERGDQCFDQMCIKNDAGDLLFEDVMNMSYEELKSYDNLEAFVDCAMSLSNKLFQGEDDQTIVTLIGEDDVFIWSIIMGPEENELLRYVLVDWKKDGKQYRYEKD